MPICSSSPNLRIRLVTSNHVSSFKHAFTIASTLRFSRRRTIFNCVCAAHAVRLRRSGRNEHVHFFIVCLRRFYANELNLANIYVAEDASATQAIRKGNYTMHLRDCMRCGCAASWIMYRRRNCERTFHSNVCSPSLSLPRHLHRHSSSIFIIYIIDIQFLTLIKSFHTSWRRVIIQSKLISNITQSFYNVSNLLFANRHHLAGLHHALPPYLRFSRFAIDSF